MKNVRFGIAGSGYFGGELARIIGSIEHAEVTAVYGGSRAGALAEALGCDAANTLEQLAARNDVDAVIVASPSHAHREPVIEAARQGKHVFCEKPIALSLSDCEDMLEACRTAGVHFMAGHIMHFMNGIRTLKRLIAAGEIGRPIVCHAERTGWEEKQAVVSWKKNKAASGGHLFHHIHELDLLQAIMGPASSVVAAGGNLAHRGEGYGDEEDVLLLTLAFPGGAIGTMQYGSGFRWGDHFVKINGTDGAIKVDLANSFVELRKEGQTKRFLLNHSEEADAERAQSYSRSDGGIVYGTASSRLPMWLSHVMREEMAYFRDVVAGKPIDGEFLALFDGTSARSSIAAAAGAMASLQGKRWVDM